MRPVLFYTVGLPGAGKSTFARSLSYWLEVEHIRGDKIGLELFRFPTFSPQERAAVYSEMARRSGESLRSGRHVLYDAAVNSRAQRDELALLAKRHGGVAVGVWLQVPNELAMKRAGKVRDGGLGGPVGRIIPPQLFMQYAQAFEQPDTDEAVILVAGNAPFALQYRRLQRQLGRGLPRIV